MILNEIIIEIDNFEIYITDEFDENENYNYDYFRISGIRGLQR